MDLPTPTIIIIVATAFLLGIILFFRIERLRRPASKPDPLNFAPAAALRPSSKPPIDELPLVVQAEVAALLADNRVGEAVTRVRAACGQSNDSAVTSEAGRRKA